MSDKKKHGKHDEARGARATTSTPARATRDADGPELGTLLSEVPRDKWGHPILPVPENMSRKEYERELLALQIELVKMQTWAREENQRVLVVFEGRDSAGKGGTIQRMREHLNPRFARHVALQTPTDVERGQWYFQRYVEQLPTHGEIAFFDRSWYNRAGVERVMGFATDEQIDRFFEQVVPFEQFLVSDGIHFVKIWLSIAQEEQVKRLEARRTDPLEAVEAEPAGREGARALGGLHGLDDRHLPPHRQRSRALVVREQQREARGPDQRDPPCALVAPVRREGHRCRAAAAPRHRRSRAARRDRDGSQEVNPL